MSVEGGPKGAEYEHPDYELGIVVYRHGPKEPGEPDGGLDPAKKQDVYDEFSKKFHGGKFHPDSGGSDIESSPVNRAFETSEIYTNAIEDEEVGDTTKHEVDDRLGEGNIGKYVDQLAGKHNDDDIDSGKTFFTKWLELDREKIEDGEYGDLKTGEEAITDFSNWLLEKINGNKENGGTQEIDALSHGPLMAGFVLEVEKRMGIKDSSLPKGWEKDNKELLFKEGKKFEPVSSMSFYTSSKIPEIIYFAFDKKRIEVPLSIIEEMAGVEDNDKKH